MSTELSTATSVELFDPADITLLNRLEILEDSLRKKYLSRLDNLQIIRIEDLQDLEIDIINNVRLFKITEMVYSKGEPVTDKFTTVFNTLSTYNSSVFVLIDSDGANTSFYLGVRNNEPDDSPYKRSTVTLGDTLKQTLIGHFPGAKIKNENRSKIAEISKRIHGSSNVASVSVVGNSKIGKDVSNEQFVQGLEKLALAMHGRPYIGLIIANVESSDGINQIRKYLQDAYTNVSRYQKIQLSRNSSESTSHTKSFAEMSDKQKTAMIGGAVVSLASAGLDVSGNILAGQVAGQISNFIGSLAPSEQVSTSTSDTVSTTFENKAVTDLMALLDEQIKKTNEYDSYGLWNVAGYFISDDMSASEIAASNYRSLMNGENSGREMSAINSWRRNGAGSTASFSDLTLYLSRFAHPQFDYGGGVPVDAATAVSGKELGLHLGLPRATVPGLPVIEHAEFGKEVTTYQLIPNANAGNRPEDRITIGRIFDLGKVSDNLVELNNKSLNMHTFITGSTGSGKSNAVYQMLAELRQDRIPFLVIEPAKGEYKDAFGNLPDVRVFSTNPNVAPLINLNPFMFPPSIHVLEHVDGLVEIFGVCWPMYDAMPAFFKDAILRSYESIGWDLGSSTFDGDTLEFPDFEILAEQLDELIGNSDYASDIKSNYRGALLTRVKSLTVGLNKYIFTSDQTPYEQLFDENCILDISRVRSAETKALIMGLMVYALNEYRVDCKTESNRGLEHITVLEEAHNLLKNTSGGGSSELIGKSVEMLTNTIAEIRTYGEGFVIVDQSPSSVDIAAIKNTNTKIILRTPEANDRAAVGRSIGLTDDQVAEIAKLPSGVAVVYQNNWISPVLTLIDKANINESPFAPMKLDRIITVRTARTLLVRMLLQQWVAGKRIGKTNLLSAVKVLDLSRKCKRRLEKAIDEYDVFGGRMMWKQSEMAELQDLIRAVLGISVADIDKMSTPDELRNCVSQKLHSFSSQNVETTCYFLTTNMKG